MRIWIFRDADGALQVRSGSQLGETPIQATRVVAGDPASCTWAVHASSETREENPANVELALTQSGADASGKATLERMVTHGSSAIPVPCRHEGKIRAKKER